MHHLTRNYSSGEHGNVANERVLMRKGVRPRSSAQGHCSINKVYFDVRHDPILRIAARESMRSGRDRQERDARTVYHVIDSSRHSDIGYARALRYIEGLVWQRGGCGGAADCDAACCTPCRRHGRPPAAVAARPLLLLGAFHNVRGATASGTEFIQGTAVVYLMHAIDIGPRGA